MWKEKLFLFFLGGLIVGLFGGFFIRKAIQPRSAFAHQECPHRAKMGGIGWKYQSNHPQDQGSRRLAGVPGTWTCIRPGPQ